MNTNLLRRMSKQSGTEETICDVRHLLVIGAEADMALTAADDEA